MRCRPDPQVPTTPSPSLVSLTFGFGPTGPRRAPVCDASAAAAAHLCAVATRLCGALLGLVDEIVSVTVPSACARGVHVADLVRRSGAAGLTSPSAEAAGGVKRSPAGPSAASCAAVLL